MERDALVRELNALRQQVSGVTDTLVAGVDGLLIVADTEARIDPEGVSALAAAHLGLAHTTAAATGQGAFRQAVVHSSGGYLATGMLPAVETTDAHPPEVLDLLAGATLDLFRRPSSTAST